MEASTGRPGDLLILGMLACLARAAWSRSELLLTCGMCRLKDLLANNVGSDRTWWRDNEKTHISILFLQLQPCGWRVSSGPSGAISR